VETDLPEMEQTYKNEHKLRFAMELYNCIIKSGQTHNSI